MRFLSNLLFLLVIASAITGCKDKIVNPNKDLTLQDYESLDTSLYALNSHRIRENIAQLVKADADSMQADFKTKSHYIVNGTFLWIDRHGLKSQVDTLVSYLQEVKEMGFSPKKFRVSQIEKDLRRARELDFDTAQNNINRVMARLEYNLTKAYLRYVTGQRFGYMNPAYVFNRLDAMDGDSVHIRYRGLFAIPMEKPGKHFFSEALSKIANDSVPLYLGEIQPKSKLYYKLKDMLKDAATEEARAKILCNMERCRWQIKQPSADERCIIVNIPSQQLWATCPDSVVPMRICCGSFTHKTPLLCSEINYMQVNPEWIIPHNIIKAEVAPHAGDSVYFARNDYSIVDRSTNDTLDVKSVSSAELKSGQLRVVQKSGPRNSLGRIVFRFPNNFSIYLHDTNNRSAFNRERRTVSHGCVRVQKPFELACFLLPEATEWKLEQMRISMDIPPKTKRGKDYLKTHKDDPHPYRLVSYQAVSPKMPVYILYFTTFPNPETGKMESLSDLYGYDKVIKKEMGSLLR